MNDQKEELKNQLQVDFEEAITEKNKTINKLEKERDSAISAQIKSEKAIDELKDEVKVYKNKAERAQAKYLRDQELKSRSESQERDLLGKLFGE